MYCWYGYMESASIMMHLKKMTGETLLTFKPPERSDRYHIRLGSPSTTLLSSNYKSGSSKLMPLKPWPVLAANFGSGQETRPRGLR